MGQRDNGREIPTAAHALGHGDLSGVGQVGRLRVGSDQQGQPIWRKLVKDTLVPCGCAFGPGRGVSAARLAGVAKAHGHQRQDVGIVERGFAQPQPFAQPIAAVIVPRDAAGVNFGARRLADDEDAGAGGELDDGRSPFDLFGEVQPAFFGLVLFGAGVL